MEQTHKLLHTSNLYYSPPSIELAAFLVTHGGLDKVFFCNSGAEAVETAIKLARKYQWRQGHKEKNIILTANRSFHGRTLGALTATAKPTIHEGFGPLPSGFRYSDWNDSDAFCAAIDEQTAAVLLEPIQGEGGIHVPPAGLLAAVRKKCDALGVLLIFDEIQCGVGRTGDLFAYLTVGVTPDIITLAKGIANGLPLGAVCAREQVANAMQPGDHGSTFGGNPVACNAALANLTVIQENYLPQVKKLSTYLLQQLTGLQKAYPEQIKAIRGAGLMLGIEVAQQPQQILQHCLQAGLLINVTADRVLRILPPYIITSADIDFAIETIRSAFNMTKLTITEQS
jgi:predicted acetylornithine/succinylornithine family transaminase